MSYPPVLPRNLATNEVIDEPWVDGVSNMLTVPVPWGPVQPPVVIAVNQLNIAAGAPFNDLTGFAITVPVNDRRWYEVIYMLETQQNTATANVDLQMSVEGGTPVTSLMGSMVQAATQLNVWSGVFHFYGGTVAPIVGGAVYTPPGLKLVKLMGRTSAGTFSILNGGTMNGRFAIKDIGGW